MNIREILAGNDYIVLPRFLVREFDSLSKAIIFSELCALYTKYGNDFFYTQEQLCVRTCLSIGTVKKGIAQLKQDGYIDIKRKGLPAKAYYFITDKIEQLYTNKEVQLGANKIVQSCTNKEVQSCTDYYISNNNNINKNNIDKSILQKETKKSDKFDFVQALVELGVDEIVAKDWVNGARKTKKASNSKTAFITIKNQIEKSKLTPTECIAYAESMGWKGFMSDWVDNQNNSTSVQNKQAMFKNEENVFGDNTNPLGI